MASISKFIIQGTGSLRSLFVIERHEFDLQLYSVSKAVHC